MTAWDVLAGNGLSDGLHQSCNGGRIKIHQLRLFKVWGVIEHFIYLLQQHNEVSCWTTHSESWAGDGLLESLESPVKWRKRQIHSSPLDVLTFIKLFQFGIELNPFILLSSKVPYIKLSFESFYILAYISHQEKHVKTICFLSKSSVGFSWYILSASCQAEKQVHFHNVLKVLYFRALILYFIY